MRRAALIAVFPALVALMFAPLYLDLASRHGFPGGSCVKPAALLPSQTNAAVVALEDWAELEAAKWSKVKHGGLVQVGYNLAPGELARAAPGADGLRPGRLDVDVNMAYDAELGFFGEIVAAEAWRNYSVVLKRDCVGDDWYVAEARFLGDGDSKGPGKGGPVGSVGVPDAS
jgi:hypothetical protein